MLREYIIPIFAASLTVFVPLQGKSGNQSQDKNTTASSPAAVSVYVRVLEKKTGQLIRGLNREELSVYDGGVKQDIQAFHEDEGAVSAIVLLDVSGSMRYSSKLIHEVVTDVVNSLGLEDEVALIVFADSSKLVFPFTKDKNLLKQTTADLEKQKVYGPTQERQGLHTAIKQSLSGSNPSYRRMIILIADNVLYWHEEPYSQLDILKELVKSGATVHGLIVPSHEPRFMDQLPKAARQDVSIYVRETGGMLLDLRDEQARLRIRRTTDNSHSLYRLKYVPGYLSYDRAHPKTRLKISPEVEKRVGKIELSFRIINQ